MPKMDASASDGSPRRFAPREDADNFFVIARPRWFATVAALPREDDKEYRRHCERTPVRVAIHGFCTV